MTSPEQLAAGLFGVLAETTLATSAAIVLVLLLRDVVLVLLLRDAAQGWQYLVPPHVDGAVVVGILVVGLHHVVRCGPVIRTPRYHAGTIETPDVSSMFKRIV